jgi:hypothetical protein
MFRALHLPYLLVLLLLPGCGEGFPRHRLSGKVTYQGKPVEYGTIVFEPEESIGKIAPTGFARIENDKSKMKLDAGPNEIIDTPELFPEHILRVEIPPPDGKLDIEVPATAKIPE